MSLRKWVAVPRIIAVSLTTFTVVTVAVPFSVSVTSIFSRFLRYMVSWVTLFVMIIVVVPVALTLTVLTATKVGVT